MVVHRAGDAFVKIVYAKVQSNGRTEMVPLKLHVDGSFEYITESLFTSPELGVASQTLLGNRYRVQRVLGQGGFGRTYLAADQHRFDELCVVKEFLPQSAGEDETQKSRDLFEQEAKILHQIDHLQIPKFLASFEDMGRLFLVQEYVKGLTYSSLLRERQQQSAAFSETEVIQWLKHLLPVLNYIHERGIIHRDISPDNIMLDQGQNIPILIDFGVGKWTIDQLQLSNHAPSYSRKRSVVGKVGYAPREQIWMGCCFPSSDLYSLAVTAVVLLTGKEPQSLINPRSLEWHWRDFAQVSNHLSHILNTMLSDKPAERYPSAALALEALNSSATTIVSQAPSVTRMGQFTTLTVSPSAPQLAINHLFIEHCERELTSYIGPIAKFLVQETLSHPAARFAPQICQGSHEAFVLALAEKIPNHHQAVEFQRRLLRL